MTAWGRANSFGALVLGPPLPAGALDLTGIGMTGCLLHVQPLVSVLAPVTQVPPLGADYPDAPYGAYIDLQTPYDLTLVGGRGARAVRERRVRCHPIEPARRHVEPSHGPATGLERRKPGHLDGRQPFGGRLAAASRSGFGDPEPGTGATNLVSVIAVSERVSAAACDPGLLKRAETLGPNVRLNVRLKRSPARCAPPRRRPTDQVARRMGCAPL